MRRVHPLWRGFWLACVVVATLASLSGVDWLAAFRGGQQALALALGVAAGAFLAALPGLLRRREEKPPHPRWQELLTAFLCGVAMTISCGMAGTGRIIPALLEGSTGAYAFAGSAGLTAFITARIAGRRART